MSGSAPLTILHPLDLHDRGRPVRRDHGAVGQRQVDAARADRRPRRADVGHDPDRRRRHHAARRGRARAAARREDRLRLPVLPPDPVADGARERRSCRWRSPASPTPRRARRALLEEVGPDGPRPSLSVAAVGRRAAARRDRARAGQRSADPAGRRADRQSRQRQRPAHHGPAASASTARARTTLVLVTHDAALAALADAQLALATDGRARAPTVRRVGAGGARSMRFVLRMAVRETRAVVAAAAVLLRLHRRRRRRHRRAALGHPERARRASTRRGTHAHRRRRRSISTGQALDAEARARRSTRAWPRAGASTRTETVETPTMVRPADAAKRRGADGGAARACSRDSRSTARSSSRAASAYSHALLEDHGALVRPELLTALGVGGRRRARHRPERRSRFAA